MYKNSINYCYLSFFKITDVEIFFIFILCRYFEVLFKLPSNSGEQAKGLFIRIIKIIKNTVGT